MPSWGCEPSPSRPMYMPLRSRMCCSGSSVRIDRSSYAMRARAIAPLSPADRVGDAESRRKRKGERSAALGELTTLELGWSPLEDRLAGFGAVLGPEAATGVQELLARVRFEAGCDGSSGEHPLRLARRDRRSLREGLAVIEEALPELFHGDHLAHDSAREGVGGRDHLALEEHAERPLVAN